MKFKKDIRVFFSRHLLIVFSVVFILFSSAFHLSAQDTIPKNQPADTAKVKESSSGIKSKVAYTATDSMRFDVTNQKMYLYGDAQVKYEDMELQAGYIEFNLSNNIAFSRGVRDSLGNAVHDSSGLAVGDPVFSQGPKSFDAKEITYNFQTKKGKIREVTTQEGEAFIHAKDAKKDTGDVYYIKNGRYTTCDLEQPHFYIKSTKLKIIPDDKIIAGPSYLVIADIPTPLCLPFGVFPNKTGRKSGVLIPFYGESNLGYFLKDGGYYFGMSDYFDLALKGDIYSKGSYGVHTISNYTRRYKYSGNLSLSYSKVQISEKEFPDYNAHKDFFIRWTHMQDAKSNPTVRFSANVNAGSSNYQTFNATNPNLYLANTFASNVALNKSWQGSPNNFSLNATHSQNTKTKIVDVTLPDAAFTMGRRYWFKNLGPEVGRQNIIQKIGISPAFYFKNHISTYDSLLFKPSAIQKFQNGFKGSVPVSTSQNIGPVTFSPSASLNGYGYFQTIRQRWDLDTVKHLNVYKDFIDTVRGFTAAYDYNAAVSASTKFFGMYMFKRGRVKAIRHVMTPNVSYSVRPDFSKWQYGYYRYVQSSIKGDSAIYSIFQNGIFGSPPSGKAGFVNLSLSNNLEMKLRPSKKDTSTQDRKIVLIENLSIASSYNVAAEHYKWSTTNISARTKLFKKVDLTMSGVLDPYYYNARLKRREERFVYDVNGKLARLTSAAFSMSTSLRSLTKKKDAKSKKAKRGLTPLEEDQFNYAVNHPDYYVDFNVPWDLSVYYNVVYAKPALSDTVIQSLTFSGNVNVTSNWKIGFRSGFDFVKKDFTFTSFDIYRDLHCWEMHLNWIPFGFRKSYMLTIAVKASVLQDMKLMRKRDWYDYN